ncbi:MAG: acyl-CoA dehydrogenase domain-containing protein [Pseudomonadota bacterium]
MIWFGVFAALALTAAWYRASLRTTAIAFAVALVFYAPFGGSFLMFLLLWVLWAAVFIPLLLAPLRQEWISRPLLHGLQDRGEPDAPTPAAERSAANALMSGAPDWAHWLSLPQPVLTPIEQDFLDGPAETFCRTWPHPPSDLNLAAAAVPAIYGGAGLSTAAQQALLSKIASGADVPAALHLARTFQCAMLIETQGDETQKQAWLSDITRGVTMLALMQSTSEGHAGQMPDVATVERGPWKGHEVQGLRLSFDKRAIAHPSPLHAALVAVAVRRHPRIQRGWVLVPRGTAGTSPDLLSGRDVFVPLTHLLADADAATTPPAVPMAGRIATFAEHAGAMLRLKASQNEDEILLLARLGACAYTLESLRRCMPLLDSAALRLVNARYCDDGLRLAQRLGLTTEPVADAGLETAMRLARNLPGVQALRASVSEKNPALALQGFDHALTQHAQHIATCAARSLLLGLSHGRLLPAPVLGALAPYYGRVSRYSAAAGLLSATLPWLRPTPGRAVVQRELAIVWGRLCAAASILRCFENDARPQADEAFALWALSDINREIEQWLDSALHALPSRFLSVLLRVLMFPLGRWARPPREAWTLPILERLQSPQAPPLSHTLFMNATLLRLRAALLLKQECAALEPRLHDARLTQARRLDRIHEARGLGLLTNEEAAKLRELQNRIETSMPVPSSQHDVVPTANLYGESEYDKT